MPLLVEDAKYVKGPSGTMLQFTFCMSLNGDYWWRRKGCLALRGEGGVLVVLPPAQYFWRGGRKIKWRGDSWSKKLTEDLTAHIEASSGVNIVLDPAYRGRTARKLSDSDDVVPLNGEEE